jgi:anthranilate synthase component 1
MTMISFEEFEKESREYNVLPLVRSLLADLHTPVSTYLALREEGKPSFLLESVEQDEKVGRYSFVGVAPRLSLRQEAGGVLAYENGQSKAVAGNIFDALEAYTRLYRQAPVKEESLDGGKTPLAPMGLAGGFIGYVGYNAVRHLEHIEIPDGDPDHYDESRLDLFESVIRFDHRRQSITMIENVFVDPSRELLEQYESGRKALEALELRLRRSVVGVQQIQADLESPLEDASPEEYTRAVERAKRYIHEGDIFQVVLSRKTRLRYSGDLFALYRALRVINPSPYLFYIDFGHTKLVGSSPEVLIRVQRRIVDLLPIAGTRPRGITEAEDRQLEEELLSDTKETAEHIMLVDLGRNDVGRVSQYGSVEVPMLKNVERYSHVMHLVSHVRGVLRGELSAIDALRASFPAGTVSGAPKVRAMEIISELEGSSRGLYAGAVGYVGLNGTLDTCIAIRTVIAHGDQLTLQAGAGIVADSVPQQEFLETQNKMRALFAALEAASRVSGALR